MKFIIPFAQNNFGCVLHTTSLTNSHLAKWHPSITIFMSTETW